MESGDLGRWTAEQWWAVEGRGMYLEGAKEEARKLIVEGECESAFRSLEEAAHKPFSWANTDSMWYSVSADIYDCAAHIAALMKDATKYAQYKKMAGDCRCELGAFRMLKMR
jgi:hypothetical protein